MNAVLRGPLPAEDTAAELARINEQIAGRLGNGKYMPKRLEARREQILREIGAPSTASATKRLGKILEHCLSLAADTARPLPRRQQPDRYRPRPLTEEPIGAFYARVDRARERKLRAARPGNVEAFRR